MKRLVRHTVAVLVGLGCCVSVASALGQTTAGVAGNPAFATIAGAVVSDDGKPLGRVVVTVRGATLGSDMSALTTSDGHFEIRDLPPGAVTVSASKHSFMPAVFGAVPPSQTGTLVQLESGKTSQIVLRLRRTGVISGTIADTSQQGIPGLLVFALNAAQAVTTIAPRFGADATVPMSTTDSRGGYRFYDLPPGSYVVAAFAPKGDGGAPIEAVTSAEIDRRLEMLAARSNGASAGTDRTSASELRASREVFAPVFFPGTPFRGSATPIVLEPGDEQTGISFLFAPVPVSEIAGTVVGATGTGTSIQLSILGGDSVSAFSLPSATPSLVQPPDAQGRFRYSNVITGRYRIVARATFRGGRDTLYGVADIVLSGQDVEGLELALQPAPNVSGKIELEGPSPVPAAVTQFRIALRPVNPVTTGMINSTRIGDSFVPGATTPKPDGSFQIGVVPPGLYRLQVEATAALWPRFALFDGRDVLDTLLDVRVGQGDLHILVTMSERHTQVSGALQIQDGNPAIDYAIVLFSRNESFWRSASRRVRVARPDTRGHFVFGDVPDGQYLLAAVSGDASASVRSPDILSQLVATAVVVEVLNGKDVTQDLAIRKRP